MMAQIEAPQQANQPAPAATPPAAEGGPEAPGEYGHLADVPLKVEALLDRLSMNMRSVASLQCGSVLGLSRSAGDNVDLYVGGIRLASGEIVVIENTLAVRITDLLTAE
jgi:flagellar motor switch protein FliN/FliY